MAAVQHARAEEFRLLHAEARASEGLLESQLSAEAASARRQSEALAASRAHEIAHLEERDTREAAARLEAAAMRRVAEAERRERVLALSSEESRQALVEAELREAELRRTMRAAELSRAEELEAVRQDEVPPSSPVEPSEPDGVPSPVPHALPRAVDAPRGAVTRPDGP